MPNLPATTPAKDPTSVMVAELTQQFSSLGPVDRAECLVDAEQLYGRSVADRVRRAVEKAIAQQAGRLIGWSGDDFTGLAPEKIKLWSKAYPLIDIASEIAKARAYLISKPGAVKSEYERYLTKWFSRALTSSLASRRAKGTLTQTQVHQMLIKQHEATRICPQPELAEHLARPNVGARYLVDWLFDDGLQRWGISFSTRWGGLDIEALKNTWAADLAKLTHDQIRTGVVRIRRDCKSFYPNWPEFLDFCKPTDSIEVLFMRAASLSARHLVDHATAWPCPVLYWAAARFGMSTLASTSWAAARANFTSLYYDCLGQQEAGTLPAPPASVPRIAAPKQSRLSEAGTSAIAAAKAILAKGSTKAEAKPAAQAANSPAYDQSVQGVAM